MRRVPMVMGPDVRRALLLLALAGVTGCSFIPQHSQLLDEARSHYTRAAADPLVVDLAASELSEARALLEQAAGARATYNDSAVVDHIAYLAKQRVAIAREVATLRRLEMDKAGKGR